MDTSRTPRTVRDTLARARRNHRARHTATGFHFALSDRIELLDPARWDLLTADASVFLSRRYLRALESAAPDNVSPRYALISKGSDPIAAVVANVALIRGERVAGSRKTAETTHSSLRNVVHGAKRVLHAAAMKRVRARVVVCGNLLAWGQHGVAFAPGVERAEVWPAVGEALYRMRRAERLTGQTDLIVVKDLDADDMRRAEALSTLSYRSIETDPDMVLELRAAWRTFDDYVAALSTKYRKSIRQTAKDLAGARCTIEPLRDLSAESTHLHALYLQVHERAAVRPVTLAPNYLPALAEALGDDFRCTVIRRDGQVLGFVTTLRDRETAVGYYIGFDAAENTQIPLYFALLQAVIADAIALGCKRISLGRTALEPKARLGAKPMPLHLWVRHRVPVANWLLRTLIAGVPHDEAPERSPFKESGE